MNTQTEIAPRLLWFDLTHDKSASDCMAAFTSVCQINLARDLSAAGINAQQRPDMICMHYDRPDTMSLNLLIEVKRAVPSIPITMLTMHHSEELAVWAFRSGVWDYLALPLVQAERNRYLKTLRELCSLLRNSELPRQKKLLTRSNDLPESVRLTADHQKQRPLQDAIQYIDLHFKEQIEQKQLAKRYGMTPFRFSRLFKQTYGVGFIEFIQLKRMEKAEALLSNSKMSITSIAYAVGFLDPSYFARIFKLHFGCSPSDYRSIEPNPEQTVATLRSSSNPLTEEMC
ncbi:response regulator transcription factor [Pseudomonas paeninsulae]|uniref:response regulator transcription factor n=1 Tax=Pseudomonas paeninsulae TaxID=3110772 RepID=UPI002D778ABD|nr:response regulator transcription factor [Pseudomonas sp. IT1137]